MPIDSAVHTLINSNLALVHKTVMAFLPNLAIAVGLLVVGWLLAKFIAFITSKILHAADKLFSHLNGYGKYSAVTKARKDSKKILSTLSFWLVFIFFLVLAIQSLGFTDLIPWTRRLASYLPGFIGCSIIILFGYILSRIVREIIIDLSDFQHNRIFARIVGAVILTVAILYGIQQLDIDISFLVRLFNLTYAIVLASFCFAMAMAVYKIIGDLISMRMITQHLNIGQTIEVGDFSGTVSSLNNTSVTLLGQKDGIDTTLILPAKCFADIPTRVLDA